MVPGILGQPTDTAMLGDVHEPRSLSPAPGEGDQRSVESRLWSRTVRGEMLLKAHVESCRHKQAS